MKYILLLMLTVITAGVKAQSTWIESSIALKSGTQLPTIQGFGFYPTGVKDTVKCTMLITVCDYCKSTQYPGFAIREKKSYHGDPMPQGDYSDRWEVIGFLAGKNKIFNDDVIIWDYRLKN